MANHKSAKKRARQALKRRARNRHARSGAKNAVKKVRAAVAGGDATAAGAALRETEGVLRRAASRGIVPKKRVSRQVSRLARSAQRLAAK